MLFGRAAKRSSKAPVKAKGLEGESGGGDHVFKTVSSSSNGSISLLLNAVQFLQRVACTCWVWIHRLYSLLFQSALYYGKFQT